MTMKTKKSISQMRLSGEAAAAPTPADAITISGDTLRVPD